MSTLVPYDSSKVRSEGHYSGVAQAFKKAIITQCHPKMIMAIFLPFIFALVGIFLMVKLFWDPASTWLLSMANDWGFMAQTDQWLMGLGMFSLMHVIVPVMTFFTLIPIAGIGGLAIAAVFIMPMVLKHIVQRDFPSLQKSGRNAFMISLLNTLVVSLVFVIGWVLTMPLWLLVPLGLVLHVFWWAYAFGQMMKVDSMVEHATEFERQYLLKKKRAAYWLIAIICSLINLFPPAWIVMPVFTSIVFVHFNLQALKQLREQTVLEATQFN